MLSICRNHLVLTIAARNTLLFAQFRIPCQKHLSASTSCPAGDHSAGSSRDNFCDRGVTGV